MYRYKLNLIAARDGQSVNSISKESWDKVMQVYSKHMCKSNVFLYRWDLIDATLVLTIDTDSKVDKNRWGVIISPLALLIFKSGKMAKDPYGRVFVYKSEYVGPASCDSGRTVKIDIWEEDARELHELQRDTGSSIESIIHDMIRYMKNDSSVQ